MNIDFNKLDDGLNKLRGLDFEAAEQRERATGNTAAVLASTMPFHARIAAIALGVPVEDIKELPIKQYVAVTTRTSNFLFAPSDDATPAESSEA